ncbi:MAG: redoxin domain-containing protein [Bacteroidetes bacterium]|jgi:thiol-disulfide isomerase/thioredoxin|nr:redoxin domain-containing protein [Bacteroidota bacterium]MBT4398189.1 redoxin domain-containing protein [Bacteroidota bacterium]MBT4409452.1 redoxin domain-containing protein [Bacteroidota bacterium]MBT5428174.1 redoxin domain-containing protein [Bacteroidota bacterium]MBT7092787.1 redoxin domain-containing protein [Bacteroidota bacterium]
MKLKHFCLGLVFVFSFSFSGLSQYTVELRVDSMPTPKAYLLDFRGLQPKNMLDSVNVKIPGQINFILPEEAHPGMYRIVMGPRTWLDFIFNRENIQLHTHFAKPDDSLRVIESTENKLFTRYKNFFMVLNRKQQALVNLMNLYPANGSFYKTLEQEFKTLQQTNPEEVGKDIIRDFQDTYVARFLKVEQNPHVPVGLSLDEELEYLLEHFFDLTDFSDADLIYSPSMISKVHRYFGIIQQAFPPLEVEDEMISGVNRVLSLAAINDDVYEFLLEELTRVFEPSEYETLFAYFTENFLMDASCTDENRNQELSEILASIKKTEIGIKAPEIILPLEKGPVIVSEIKANYILIIFWASWCPHCAEMMPEIKSLYNQYKSKGFEIVAISLDKENSEYQKALSQGKYPWINYSELKGWDCSIAYDYGIRATPAMILLDQNRRIIEKPRNPVMLKSVLAGIM